MVMLGWIWAARFGSVTPGASLHVRTLSVAVGLGLLVFVGCGGGGDGQETLSRDGCQPGGLGLVPVTHREDDRIVLPVVFPEGTRAELVYPSTLDVAGLGVFPYSSARLRGMSPIQVRGDIVGRDFWIRCGELDEILATWNDGRPPTLLARYEGAGRTEVGFWDVSWNDNAHYLGFQFGRWAVLVYDYVAAGAMTDSERASWAASFTGRESDEGFLLLEGSGPLRLAQAHEHAGPQLTFAAGEPTRDLTLFPGPCRPHRDQSRLVDGKLVQWSGGFADWCLSESMRIHASGSKDFIGTLVRDLAVRNVDVAEG